MGEIAAQGLQVVGALLILVAFAMVQFRMLDPQSVPYLLLNLIGSALLGYLAAIEQQWGFLLLETVWAIVSLWSLIARRRGSRPPGPAH